MASTIDELLSPDSLPAKQLEVAPADDASASSLTGIACVHGKSTGFSNVHPCTTFAQMAGFESWEAAVRAMRSGRVVTAQGPRLGRASMIEFLLFQRQIERDGLCALPAGTWSGQFSVGYREFFSPDAFRRGRSDDEGIFIEP